jgi:hypothetical protein
VIVITEGEIMPEGSKGNAKPRNNSSTVLLIVFIVAILLIGIGVVAFIVLRDKNREPDASEAPEAGRPVQETREVAGSARMVLDESDAESVMDQMREEVAKGMFECKMSMTWTFEDGKAESRDAHVANSTNNTYPIYFDVYLNDTEELLYTSPVLPVGAELANIALDKELPAGDYKATVMYTLVEDEESQEPISQAGFIITIKVLN